jgi:hypothetical protein
VVLKPKKSLQENLTLSPPGPRPWSSAQVLIEYSGFQNLHDGLFATLFSIVMQQEKKEVKIQHFSLLYGIRIENEEEKAWTITLC